MTRYVGPFIVLAEGIGRYFLCPSGTKISIFIKFEGFEKPLLVFYNKPGNMVTYFFARSNRKKQTT